MRGDGCAAQARPWTDVENALRGENKAGSAIGTIRLLPRSTVGITLQFVVELSSQQNHRTNTRRWRLREWEREGTVRIDAWKKRELTRYVCLPTPSQRPTSRLDSIGNPFCSLKRRCSSISLGAFSLSADILLPLFPCWSILSLLVHHDLVETVVIGWATLLFLSTFYYRCAIIFTLWLKTLDGFFCTLMDRPSMDGLYLIYVIRSSLNVAQWLRDKSTAYLAHPTRPIYYGHMNNRKQFVTFSWLLLLL